MKILAIDIGAGTQDILLYDPEKNIENNIKLVLPSPTQIFAKKIKKVTEKGRDLVIYGETIGGGAFTKAIKNHIKNGHKVYMSVNTALSIRNKIEEVKALGVNVFSDVETISHLSGIENICLYEVFLEEIFSLLSTAEEHFSDIETIAVAVLDHGKAPVGVSDRKFRVKLIEEILNDSPNPWTLAFLENEIPNSFLRMRSVVREIQNYNKKHQTNFGSLVMDTSAAAILGAINDPIVTSKRKVVAMDVGNSHTMVTVIYDNEIKAIMEHHTHMLSTEKLVNEIIALSNGKLKNETVFNEGGHGVVYLDNNISWEEIEIVAATGPKRKLLEKALIPVHFASPSGDVMMTGPVGLVEAAKRKFGNEF
ncbi:MAG: DUF1786 domain-containing protein [Candidatus Heimdallarchaeum aukensis]|uniref:DUF1786 domain-containing protein n=1 Tax=Candidatus Heimdallarchaeum aukensis TaxID=2876573 RepID=A0A9Y1BND1_9ARCH|nr:MAG: DUF1786 domain-containing protein [Candidatus Heimdallarchaeum aukensis]